MLNVDHLTKRYGNVIAVDGLSFEVGPGRGHRLPWPDGGREGARSWRLTTIQSQLTTNQTAR
jgi:ABC-type branched-subunit amino acid transport system ATPase component